MAGELAEAAPTAKSAPGPHGERRYVGAGPYIADRLGYLYNLTQTYGDVARFRMGVWDIYLVNHPDLVKQVLVTEAPNTTKSAVIKIGRILLGNGLLSSEGELHRRQRRLMAPAFHKQRIEGYCRTMAAHAARLGEGWQDGQEVDMSAEMNRVTLSIIGETMFGADVEEQARAVNRALETVFAMLNRLTGPVGALLCLLPLPSNFRFLYARHRLNKIVYGMIHERRNSGEQRDDVLGMLLEARDEEGDGTGMSDQQVRDEVLILFLAGHETTANTLAWTWYLLSQHPEVEAKVHAELETVLGGRAPELADLPRLTYLRQVIEESMRVYPTVYAMDRTTTKDLEIGGYTVPKGKTIFVSPWCMHHDPRYFPDPFTFDPDRWTPEEKAKRPRYSFFPFGGGPRTCIGEQFAWAEATVVLATLAQRWQARLVEGHPVEPYPLITVRQKHGLRVTLTAR